MLGLRVFVNVHSGKYHKKSPCQFTAAYLCDISLDDHSEIHASRRIADLRPQQNFKSGLLNETLSCP